MERERARRAYTNSEVLCALSPHTFVAIVWLSNDTNMSDTPSTQPLQQAPGKRRAPSHPQQADMASGSNRR
jgi:hypothetical protein